MMSPQLKLIALDADDLAVISTHVQDARVQPSDIIWRQGEKRLVVGMSRLDWEQTLAGETEQRRLVSALRFDRVPVNVIAMAFCRGPTFFSSDGFSFMFTITISGRPSPSRSPVARPRDGRGSVNPGPAEPVTSAKCPLPRLR